MGDSLRLLISSVSVVRQSCAGGSLSFCFGLNVFAMSAKGTRFELFRQRAVLHNESPAGAGAEVGLQFAYGVGSTADKMATLVFNRASRQSLEAMASKKPRLNRPSR